MDNTFQTIFVLALLFVVAVLAFAVLILLEDRRTAASSAQPAVLTLITSTDQDEEEQGEECTVCHGMGCRDITDEDTGRPVLFDVECWNCDGQGRVQVGA